MASPPSSPDLHPPSYLNPSSSPPQLSPHFLPPPAVTPPFTSPSTLQHSPLQQLHNQSLRLTSELQHLLNTQSSTLLSPSPSPSNPTHTLTSARTGILSAMRELADVKSQEASIYSTLTKSRKYLLTTITTHTQKSTLLRNEIEKIDASPSAIRASELRAETAKVEGEIVELQRKLKGLEKKLGGMKREMEGVENVVEARKSSYRDALEAVERKTRGFLREYGGESAESVVEAWGLEVEAFAEKKEEAEREEGALREGMELWEGAMRRVCGFEEGLKRRIEMGVGGLGGLKEEIEKVTEELEDMVETAERRGWKLMVVAVGAELQAFKEAGEVLKSQLQLIGGGGSSTDTAGKEGVNRHGFGNVGDDGGHGDMDRFLGDVDDGRRNMMNHSPLDD